jgi:hypothetical protein
MSMAMRLMKGGPSWAGSFARLCAVAGPNSGRYSTAAAATTAGATTTVTKIVTQPAVHGTVIAHGSPSHPITSYPNVALVEFPDNDVIIRY